MYNKGRNRQSEVFKNRLRTIPEKRWQTGLLYLLGRKTASYSIMNPAVLWTVRPFGVAFSHLKILAEFLSYCQIFP